MSIYEHLKRGEKDTLKIGRFDQTSTDEVTPEAKGSELRVQSFSPIIGFLTQAFADDYERRKLSMDQAGWRGLLDIVESTGIPKNQVYGDSRYSRGFGKSLESLLKAGLVEHRSFSGRGRGGTVTRVRVRYEKGIVRKLVDRLSLKQMG